MTVNGNPWDPDSIRGRLWETAREFYGGSICAMKLQLELHLKDNRALHNRHRATILEDIPVLDSMIRELSNREIRVKK